VSVPRELGIPGRTRSMDNELRGEHADLVFNIAITVPLLVLGAALIAQGGLLNYTYAALALGPAVMLILRSIVRLGSM
jgi:hypothetical protein